ncbi:hypothetical protein F4820DRAFT_421212 [Hypoxylon rubiginosum]|uniref:Uncharacterized protein n=1 Tax=Hypoxylon rubiginosum TaxID=110542 RepID=A0ACB9Z1Z5_9PEZI|nr:hypothetical protein F4820DRAFT_421212 [Hypoxylon rubiginosum]
MAQSSNSNAVAMPDHGMTACVFQAIPLAHLGVPFRDLSDYGIVDHESAHKLVMTITHQDPLSVVMVIKQAWVTKYVPAGTQIALRFGPLVAYANVEIVMEKVGVANNINVDAARGLPQLSSTLSVRNHRRLYTIHEEEEEEGGASKIDKGKEKGHPRMNFDYFGEMKAHMERAQMQRRH